jgi:hypothetical protein
VDAFQKIDKALKKEPLDEAIPALARFLAAAGAFSGVSQKVFTAYVSEMIEEAYEEMERRKQ